jgi:hypothetical protein
MALFVLPLLLLLLQLRVQAQTYCQRGAGPILDNAGQCLLSSNYNVANCCYVCPVQNSMGYFSYCMSLYDLGFATCGQPGALSARQAACTAIGGSISSGAFMCVCNGGTNTSQTTNYTASVPTSTPTAGVALTVPSLLLLVFPLAHALIHH